VSRDRGDIDVRAIDPNGLHRRVRLVPLIVFDDGRSQTVANEENALEASFFHELDRRTYFLYRCLELGRPKTCSRMNAVVTQCRIALLYEIGSEEQRRARIPIRLNAVYEDENNGRSVEYAGIGTEKAALNSPAVAQELYELELDALGREIGEGQRAEG